MQTIYCISGLGADQRIFKKLSIKGATLVPVFWDVFDKHDDIPCYAQKLSHQIKEEHPVIMGVSFGGMIASEIAKIRPVKQVFLISSAKDATELAPVGKFWRFMVNNRMLPVGLSKFPNKPTFERFGASSEEDKALLMDILKHTDNKFTTWAMKAIQNWGSTTHVEGIVHIHGTADKLIFPEFVKPTYWIEGGTHLMVYQRADEISRLVERHL